MRLVPLDTVQNDDILAVDVYDEQGIVLLRSGTALTVTAHIA